MPPKADDKSGRGAAAGNGLAASGAMDGTPSASRNVHDVLRRLILHSELAPGAEISQLDLSRELSVSRTPLREALKQLEREGLVVNRGPHRTVKVSPLSMADLDDLYSLRVMGESLAISLTVPRLRAADFESLEEDLELSFTAGTQQARDEGHSRFHSRLRSGTGPRLYDHLERLFEHAERYQRAFTEFVSSRIPAKHAEHQRILEACRARDRMEARTLLVDHVADTATTLMSSEGYAPVALPAAVEMAKMRDSSG